MPKARHHHPPVLSTGSATAFMYAMTILAALASIGVAVSIVSAILGMISR